MQDPDLKGRTLPHVLFAALAIHLNFQQFFSFPPTLPFTTAQTWAQIQTIL